MSSKTYLDGFWDMHTVHVHQNDIAYKYASNRNHEIDNHEDYLFSHALYSAHCGSNRYIQYWHLVKEERTHISYMKISKRHRQRYLLLTLLLLRDSVEVLSRGKALS